MSVLNKTGMPLLRLFDAETAHGLAITALKSGLIGASPALPGGPLEVEAFGLTFPNPVGLAAGFDKDAEVPDAILGLGFGFAEVGTITPLAQAGNPRPRMFRLTEDRAVINRLGFNNQGHQAALKRLQARPRSGIVGVNIGANKDSVDKIADYELGVKTFANFASYLTVNVSSPNTPGLRGLQDRGALEELLERVGDARKEAEACPPLLLKIAPDLDDEALQDIAEVVLKAGIDGVIVSNTTIARPPLSAPDKDEQGGLSGAPLFSLSTKILAKFHRATAGKVPLIGVGGIESGSAAWEKLRAGASLVQIYSGMVYEGPRLAQQIGHHLSQQLERSGFDTLSDVTGTGAKEWAEA
ncbi:MAG: quinone-dependent dihydroorotate dehydrogenase [Alphaproteobacteria bacterium]|nr:quinone-dependent dihydroorotate dehydrogenase [Alphaproteobacteria bacterium]